MQVVGHQDTGVQLHRGESIWQCVPFGKNHHPGFVQSHHPSFHRTEQAGRPLRADGDEIGTGL
jgi:hypothetical protein